MPPVTGEPPIKSEEATSAGGAATPRRRRPPRDSLTSKLVRDLAHRIDSGELAAGVQIPPERELMVQYGVSRTVVREATSSLRASGRIATHQGRGAYVLSTPPAFRLHIDPAELSTLRDVLRVMEVRVALEAEAAALAAARRTTVQLAAIDEALRELAAGLGKPDANTASDVKFHLAIAQATGNTYFSHLLEDLGPRMLPRARLDLFGGDRNLKMEYLKRLQHEHAEVFLAIKRSDAEAARAAMRLHLSNSRERLRQAFEQSP